MHVAQLRKVGEAVVLTVPPDLLDRLEVKAGEEVEIDVDQGRLVLAARQRPKYTLEELLAASDYSDGPSAEEREWLDSPPVGRELI